MPTCTHSSPSEPAEGGNSVSSDSPGTAKTLLLAFASGALAVVTFHQAALAGLAAAGFTRAVIFSTAPAAMTGIPQIVSSAFWGGLWGIALLYAVARRTQGANFWIAALLFGAALPSLVGWFIVAPIKGLPLAAGGNVTRLAVGAIVNGAWGLGTAAWLHLLRPRWSSRGKR